MYSSVLWKELGLNYLFCDRGGAEKLSEALESELIPNMNSVRGICNQTAVSVLLKLTFLFSRLGQDLGLYLFEAFLHEVLIDFEDEFTMHICSILWSRRCRRRRSFLS